MFAKLAILVSALSILAVATPSPAVGAPVDPGLGITVQDVNALVGLTCTPITVIGVGSGSSCSANTVCCDDTSHGGLVDIGCLPVTL
ncbi:fungal hydrophobin-domain-containing protein [Fomes fomentarius]|nr:fungal hydrophobin-domain-containing protein [Fomes fomentarius]